MPQQHRYQPAYSLFEYSKIALKQHFTSIYTSFYVIYLQRLAAEHVFFSTKDHMPRKPKTASASGLGMKLGRKVKIARTTLGMTQSQLAEALDVETVTISRIETGAQMPSIERLDELAKVLRVSLTSLLADTSKGGAFAEMIVEVMSGMAMRDKEFLYGFALSYAQHLRAAKKK